MTENQPLFAVFIILHVNVFGKHVCKFFSASKLNRGASLNLMPLFGSAGIVCRRRVYETVGRLSVCLSHQSAAARRCCGFAAVTLLALFTAQALWNGRVSVC